MKIGISAFATDSGKSGISQYVANVVGRLIALAPCVGCFRFSDVLLLGE